MFFSFAVVLTTLVSCLMVGNTMGDTTAGAAEEWNQNPYQYWNPGSDGSVLASPYRRQFGPDTSPNPLNALAQPGVAAALFFSSAGVSVYKYICSQTVICT